MANPYTTLEAINSFVVGLKSDGVWSKITEAYLMAGVTFGGITIKLKGTGTLTNNNFVSGDYQATGTGAGLTGDGSTKYIDTGFAGFSGAGYYWSMSIYRANGGTNAIQWDIGVSDSNGQKYIAIIKGSGGNTRYTYGYGQNLYNNSTNHAEFVIGTSRAINDHEVYSNGVSDNTSTSTRNELSTTSIYEHSIGIFKASLSSGSYSDATLTFAHIGTGLTDADASNLTNRVETLMDALGCGVIS